MRTIALLTVAVASLFLIGARPPLKTSIVPATGDSYVATNSAAQEDPEGLRDRNFGSLDFIKVWYASKL